MNEIRCVVVGAGPAGLAAAASAAANGGLVTLIDDNPSTGGQIWRSAVGKRPPRALRRLLTGAWDTKTGTVVVDAPESGWLTISHSAGCESLPYDRLILATGARELFLPFPGWTLPGVMGAGGAQALLKGGADFTGKRVVVSGSGPLLIAVAAAFAHFEADLVCICEQTPAAKLAAFALRSMNPSRMVEGGRYFAEIGAAPYLPGAWVTAARGDGQIREVEVFDGSGYRTEPCDLLACGYGLVPNTELATLLGCQVTRGRVVVDAEQRTSVTDVFAVGEAVGIGGLDVALQEGTLAGRVAAGKSGPAPAKVAAKHARFRAALEHCFALRPEVLSLAESETLVCRCEDVPLCALANVRSGREAKLSTRIGMGPCQGRICGPAAALLFGWEPDHVRPPLFPTEVNSLAALPGP